MRDIKPKKNHFQARADARKGGTSRAEQMRTQTLLTSYADKRDAETITKFLNWRAEHPAVASGEALAKYLEERGAERARAERCAQIALKQDPRYKEFRLGSVAEEHSMDNIAFRGLDHSKGRRSQT